MVAPADAGDEGPMGADEVSQYSEGGALPDGVSTTKEYKHWQAADRAHHILISQNPEKYNNKATWKRIRSSLKQGVNYSDAEIRSLVAAEGGDAFDVNEDKVAVIKAGKWDAQRRHDNAIAQAAVQEFRNQQAQDYAASAGLPSTIKTFDQLVSYVNKNGLPEPTAGAGQGPDFSQSLGDKVKAATQQKYNDFVSGMQNVMSEQGLWAAGAAWFDNIRNTTSILPGTKAGFYLLDKAAQAFDGSSSFNPFAIGANLRGVNYDGGFEQTRNAMGNSITVTNVISGLFAGAAVGGRALATRVAQSVRQVPQRIGNFVARNFRAPNFNNIFRNGIQEGFGSGNPSLGMSSKAFDGGGYTVSQEATNAVHKAANSIGLKVSNYVDDIYATSGASHFILRDGRRVLALNEKHLAKGEAFAVRAAFHELGHSQRFESVRSKLFQPKTGTGYGNAWRHMMAPKRATGTPLYAREEVFVDKLAMRRLERMGIEIPERLMQHHQAYINYWRRFLKP